jgi:hypothetical protein
MTVYLENAKKAQEVFEVLKGMTPDNAQAVMDSVVISLETSLRVDYNPYDYYVPIAQKWLDNFADSEDAEGSWTKHRSKAPDDMLSTEKESASEQR